MGFRVFGFRAFGLGLRAFGVSEVQGFRGKASKSLVPLVFKVFGFSASLGLIGDVGAFFFGGGGRGGRGGVGGCMHNGFGALGLGLGVFTGDTVQDSSV